MIKINKLIIIILISLICITKVNAKIEDSILITVGNKAITKLDILNEIKIILILNNESYSDEKRQQLYDMAVKAAIKRNIKKIEVDKNNFLTFDPREFIKELNRMANNLNMDLDTLKNICVSNQLNFSLIEEKLKTELLWKSLIFYLYADRITINSDEINEQLKLFKNKKEFTQYLISEIVIKPSKNDNLESQIDNLLNKIKTEGFESVAMNSSISESSIKGGDLGWLDENVISKEIKSKIINTKIGNVSEPIILPEGILIFKVRDKRAIEKNLNFVEIKNNLINFEKQKILNMYSLSHYDKLTKSISVNFLK